MNNEIKEILKYLEDETEWSYYTGDLTPFKILLEKNVKKLLDYITNLQEENKELENQNKNLKDVITNSNQK